MAISFVGASAVVTGSNPQVFQPAGVIQDDLVFLIVTGTGTPSTPSQFTLLSTQGTGRFISIYYRYVGSITYVNTNVSLAGASTKAVMIAYRGAGVIQTLPAYTTGTGTTATPNAATASYANEFIISIYANALNATPATWTPDAATTSRVNSANTSTINGLLIADELQAAAGASTPRAATLSASAAWASIAIPLVEQRTLYWIGGTGTWNTSSTTNWSDTSGGSAAALPPSIVDNTVIDTSSGTGTITCSSGVCRNLTVTATQAISLAGTTLNIYGSLTFPTGGSFTRGGGNTFTIQFPSIRSGNTVTLAGRDFGNATFSGLGGAWTVQDTFTVANVFTFLQGTFNSNNQTLNFNGGSGAFAMSGSLTKTINLGSSAVNVPVAIINPWTVVATNTTFNAGTSTITIGGSLSQIGTFAGGGVTYYNVTFPTGSQPNNVTTFTGANTFNTLTFQRSTNSSVRFYNITDNQTINNLVVTGSSASSRISLNGDSAIPKIFTVNTSASVANADFGNITISGAVAPISGTNLGDNGNNSGITFPAAKTVYWNLAGNQIWSAAGWAPSSGGTPNINNFPLAQDTAVFDNASTVTGTISVDQYWSVGSVNTSTRTLAMTIAHNSGLQVRSSGVTLSSAVTMTGSVPIFFYGTTGTQTFTQNSANLSGTVGITVGTAVAATAVLGGPTTSTLGQVTVTSGGFNTNGFDLTCSVFSSTNSNVRTITLGTSIINLSGTGTIWNCNNATGLTFSGASSTINLTDTTTTTRTFAGGVLTYGTLNIGGTTGTSTLAISGAGGTIGTLSSTKTVAHTIAFQSNTTINNWTVTGTVGNVVTVNSSIAGTQRTITYGGGQINLDYMSFTDINMSYTLGASNPYKVYAGANSTNNGNNNGIAFIDGTTKKAYRLTTGTSWTVPADWNSGSNTIHMIGAGGGSGIAAVSGSNRAGGAGGGGGGYTAISNYTATPSSSLEITIGASVANANGGDTGIGQNTISFVGSTTLADTAASTTHVMNVPSGTANGDLMLLYIAASANSAFSAPTGWTVVLNTVALFICRRIASSEPASYTVATSNLACTGYIATYRNAAFDVVGSSSIESSPSNAPSITVSNDNSVVLDFAIGRNASVTFTTPTGFSSIASESNTTSPSSALFSRVFNAGATGIVTTTLSAGAGFSVLLSIKPTPFYVAGGGKVGVSTTTPSSTGGAGGTGTIYDGGAGGAGSFGTVASAGHSGGGGGGAGGPNGIGGAGGNGFGNTVTTNLIAGGGGGGNGGGSAGGNASSSLSGAGGNNFSGIGGGAASSGTGNAGTFGGGGSGGVSTSAPGQGGSGIDIENTIGGGGGRGGVGYSTATTANTGLYGGGGGGGRVSTGGSAASGASGSQGVIFIVYSPGGGGTVFNVAISEGATFADVSDALIVLTGSVIEALSVADTADVVAAFASAIAENIDVADVNDVAAAFNDAVSEDLSVADAQTFVLTLNAAINEDIVAQDASDYVLTIAAAVSEALTVTDIESVIAAFAAAISENTTIEDTVSALAAFNSDITEPITVEDTESVVASFIGVITEDTQIADTPSAIADFAAAIVEAAQLADINEVVLTISTDIFEAITLEDSHTGLVTFAGVVFENIDLADSQSVVASFAAVITEDTNLQDLQEATAAFVASLAEAITVEDSSIGVRIHNSDITENTTLADTETVIAAFTSLISENIYPADAPVVIASFNSQITENLVLLDEPFPRGWYAINDGQTSNWNQVNNTDSNNWTGVDNEQATTWTKVNNSYP